jgi:predicted RNase H-like HicB family nuclease
MVEEMEVAIDARALTCVSSSCYIERKAGPTSRPANAGESPVRSIIRRSPFCTGSPRAAGLVRWAGAKKSLATARDVEQVEAMKVEVEQEADGRWIAEVSVIPGALVYAASKEEAVAKVEALVLRVLADRLEHGEPAPEVGHVFTVAA